VGYARCRDKIIRFAVWKINYTLENHCEERKMETLELGEAFLPWPILGW
jgi:hypothetical protein